MSMTLNFVDQLLSMGRHWQRLGFWTKARSIFEHLSRQPDLSPNDFQEVQDCLAEIAHKQADFAGATRHRGLRLCLDTEDGPRHFEMGRALLAEDQAERALTHLRLAVQHAPDKADFYATLGVTALASGERDEALTALRRGAELAMNDADVLGKVVHGLIDADEVDEARQVMLRARFRNPRDRRFESLWHEMQFRIIARQQSAHDEPILLPMVPSTDDKPRRFRLDGQIYRIDQKQGERRGPTERQGKRQQRRP